MFIEILVESAGSSCCRENKEIVDSCLRIEMTKKLYSSLELKEEIGVVH